MNETLIDLVADYQANELDLKARADLEAKCAENPVFRAKVEKIAVALAAVKAGRKAQMRELLEAEVPYLIAPLSAAQKFYSIAKILVPVAAIVIIVIGLTGGFRKEMSTEYLYNEYFALPLGQEIVVDAGKQLWNQAIGYFYEEEYDSAAVSFETWLAQGDTSADSEEEVKLYLAVTYLEQGSYDKAIANLRAIGPQSTYFMAEAMWYTALTYLRMGNIELAGEMLGKCLAIDNFYKKEAAKDLRKDMRRVRK